jgi:hypothetical protein
MRLRAIRPSRLCCDGLSLRRLSRRCRLCALEEVHRGFNSGGSGDARSDRIQPSRDNAKIHAPRLFVCVAFATTLGQVGRVVQTDRLGAFGPICRTSHAAVPIGRSTWSVAAASGDESMNGLQYLPSPANPDTASSLPPPRSANATAMTGPARSHGLLLGVGRRPG